MLDQVRRSATQSFPSSINQKDPTIIFSCDEWLIHIFHSGNANKPESIIFIVEGMGTPSILQQMQHITEKSLQKRLQQGYFCQMVERVTTAEGSSFAFRFNFHPDDVTLSEYWLQSFKISAPNVVEFFQRIYHHSQPKINKPREKPKLAPRLSKLAWQESVIVTENDYENHSLQTHIRLLQSHFTPTQFRAPPKGNLASQTNYQWARLNLLPLLTVASGVKGDDLMPPAFDNFLKTAIYHSNCDLPTCRIL